jgi:ABC-type transport system involved in multi-copper enzyme maturation permease subunit
MTVVLPVKRAQEIWRSLAGRERAALGVLGVALTTIVYLRGSGGAIWQSVLWVVLLSSLLVATRSAWTGLFGPVFIHDAIHSTRRSNIGLLRAGYGILLLFVLFLFYSRAVASQFGSVWASLWQPGRIPPSEMAKFGAMFFQVFSLAQLGTLLLITPVCAGGAITEEKERRTLEFLFVTNLRDREIALGKMASRISFLVLFVLTGLPIAVLLQFLGGIDPNRVLAAFAITACTLFSVSGLSLACSVGSSSTRVAIWLSYVWIAGFLVFSLGCWAIPPFVFHNGGNPILAMYALFSDNVPPTVGRWNSVLLTVVQYAFIHLIITVACCRWAIVNLRRNAVTGMDEETFVHSQVLSGQSPELPAKQGLSIRDVPVPRMVLPPVEIEPKVLPPIGSHAMLWKELYAEPLTRLGTAGRGFTIAALVLLILIGGWLLFVGFTLSAAGGHLAAFSNDVVRYGGAGAVCFFLLIVGQRAAASIASERNRQTLDSILCTDLDNREILFAKWLASVFCVRRVWIALGLLILATVFTGGLHPLGWVLFMLAWAAFASFTALIGLWFSLRAASSLRASIMTAASLIFLSIGPSFSGRLAMGTIYPYGAPPAIEWTLDLLRFGLTPPVTLQIAALTGSAELRAQPQGTAIVGFAAMGIALYGLAAIGLWFALMRTFGPTTGRMGIRKEPRSQPGTYALHATPQPVPSTSE